MTIDYDDLADRVEKFQTLRLPGQLPAMHMGTSYLIDDLWRAVKELRAEVDELVGQISDAPPEDDS